MPRQALIKGSRRKGKIKENSEILKNEKITKIFYSTDFNTV